MENKKYINWQPIVEIGIVLAAVFGTTVPLYLHTDSKLHDAIKEMQNDRKEFQKEMGDFHTQLALQDAIFKQHLMIEHDRKDRK